MNITRTQKTIVRDHLLRNPEVLRVRVMSDGAVQAYGKMPHSIVWGWFNAGWADNLLTEVQIEKELA